MGIEVNILNKMLTFLIKYGIIYIENEREGII